MTGSNRHQGAAMQLETENRNQGQWIRVTDARLDAAVATAFKDAMRKVLRGGEGVATLDLSDVVFMDSSGLGALISVLKSMPDGRQLQLYGPTTNVMRVLKLTRMDTVFIVIEADAGAAKGTQ